MQREYIPGWQTNWSSLRLPNANLNRDNLIYISSSAIQLPISTYISAEVNIEYKLLRNSLGFWWSYLIYKITWRFWGSLPTPRQKFAFPQPLKATKFSPSPSFSQEICWDLFTRWRGKHVDTYKAILLNKTTTKYSVNNTKFSVPFQVHAISKMPCLSLKLVFETYSTSQAKKVTQCR